MLPPQSSAKGTLTGSAALDQFVSGIIAGAVATTLLHPLDLVKTRFQINTAAASSKLSTQLRLPYTFAYLRNIVKTHGLAGIYQGYTANLSGATTSWGLYFLWYHLLKKAISGDGKYEIGPKGYFVSSSVAGMLTVLVANPFWVAKTRMCLQVHGQPNNYHGVRDALVRIYATEGIRGLYRGLLPGFVGVSHGGVQFVVYEEMKNYRRLLQQQGHARSPKQAEMHTSLPFQSSPPSNLELLVMSATSKIVAAGVTYPYQVVRSRAQLYYLQKSVPNLSIRFPEYPYQGIRDIIVRTFKGEGMLGFYKGIVPSTLKVLPGTCITFMVYENLSSWFNSV